MVERVALVRAPNPSPMTLDGTNSYLLFGGDGTALCIDPGPPIAQHVEALIEAAAGRQARIATILVTHGHPDHAPAAQRLAQRTGARILAHARAAFPHDAAPADGDRVGCGEVELFVIDAPGHTFDHLVFYDPAQRALFTGDVIVGEGTVVIAPPGGAMRPYQRTLQRLADEYGDAQRIYGGHGPIVDDAQSKIAEYIEHRRLRERELLVQLDVGEQTIPQLVEGIYGDTKRILWPVAARQLLAYLLALEDEGVVRSHALARPLSAHEAAILNPDWAGIVGVKHAPFVEAELGAAHRLTVVRSYERTPARTA